jgi:hypothetical protein
VVSVPLRGWPGALLALALVVAFGDIVFLGRTLQTTEFAHGTIPGGSYGYSGIKPAHIPVADPGCSAWQTDAYDRFAHRSYAAGDLPLWNPHEALGIPFAACMYPGAFSPLRILPFAWPCAGVADAWMLIRIFIAGLGVWFLARRSGLEPLPSLAAGLAFMLSGYFVDYINMVHVDAEVLLPWQLLAVDELVRRRSASCVALVAAMTALSIVAGMPESTFFALALVGFYWVFRAARSEGLVKQGTAFAIALAAGHLMAAFLLSPFVELLRITAVPQHANTVGLEHHQPFTAVTLLVPHFFGPRYESWSGIGPFDSAPHLGVAVAFLALCARGPLARFLGAFAAISLLKMYGLPGLNDVIGRLPVFSVSIFTKYVLPELALAVSVLAGVGLQRLSSRELRPAAVLARAGLLAVTLAALLALNAKGLLEHRSRWVPVVLPALALVATSGLALLQARRERRWPAALLVALVFLELALSIPRDRADRHDPAMAPPYVEFLERDLGTGRVFTLGRLLHPNTSTMFALDEVRSVEALFLDRYYEYMGRFLPVAYNDVDRAPGAAGRRLRESARFLELLGVDHVVVNEDLRDASRVADALATGSFQGRGVRSLPSSFAGGEGPVLAQASPGEATFSVDPAASDPVLRFQVAVHPASPTAVEVSVSVERVGGLERLFSASLRPGERTAAAIDLGSFTGGKATLHLSSRSPGEAVVGWEGLRLERPADGLESIFASPEARVYRDSRALPRAFVVHDARFLSADAVLPALETVDARRTVILEGTGPTIAGVGSAQVTILRHEPRTVSVECSLDAPGYLVLLDSYYPGWRATVDGVERPILRANSLFRAVFLDPGLHRVEFRYLPPSFLGGAAVSAATALLLIGAVVLERRTRGSSSAS